MKAINIIKRQHLMKPLQMLPSSASQKGKVVCGALRVLKGFNPHPTLFSNSTIQVFAMLTQGSIS